MAQNQVQSWTEPQSYVLKAVTKNNPMTLVGFEPG